MATPLTADSTLYTADSTILTADMTEIAEVVSGDIDPRALIRIEPEEILFMKYKAN